MSGCRSVSCRVAKIRCHFRFANRFDGRKDGSGASAGCVRLQHDTTQASQNVPATCVGGIAGMVRNASDNFKNT